MMGPGDGEDDVFEGEEDDESFDEGYDFDTGDVEDDLRSMSPAFADPGGRSALRAASPENPRNLPCPTCGEPDRLTPADVQLGYQCDFCADEAEGY